jgi:hypothetical protein
MCPNVRITALSRPDQQEVRAVRNWRRDALLRSMGFDIDAIAWSSSLPRLNRDHFGEKRSRSVSFCLRTIFQENRFPLFPNRALAALAGVESRQSR